MKRALFVWLISCAALTAQTQKQAQKLVETSGIRGGLVVHVGFEDARRTAAFRINNRILVHGFSTDVTRVEKAREQTLPGVFFYHLSSNRLPYADNMVNLIFGRGSDFQVPEDELRRVLVPGGLLVSGDPSGPLASGFHKPSPPDTDEWTHWLHGPDGNAVARDRVAGPPRRMQWIARPLWSRHHNTVPSVTAQVFAGGRVFYIVDDAPASMDDRAPDRWALVARDAFNGLPLWRRSIGEWGWKSWSAKWTSRFTVPTHIPKRLVAVGDRVYVTLGFNAPLVELAAATGETLRVFDGTEHTDEILLLDGRLIVAINQGPQGPGGKEGPAPVAKAVAAIDIASGRTVWKTGSFVGLRSKTGSMERISHLSMVAGDGRVYFPDGQEFVALSLKDGKEAWRAPRPKIPEAPMRYDIRISDMCSLVYGGGRLFFAQISPDRRVDWRELRGRLHAFDATTGKALWDRPCASWGWGHPADIFLLDDLVWVADYEGKNRKKSSVSSAKQLAASKQWGKTFRSAFYVGLDPATGAVRRETSVYDAFNNGHHHRCYRNKATERWLMTSYRGLEFVDWSGETAPDLNHWVRGTCRLGAFPCNGLVYANPHPCQCYIGSKLNGFVALAPGGQGAAGPFSPDGSAAASSGSASVKAAADRQGGGGLWKGPAYDSPVRHSTFGNRHSEDWPTFRHDPERSGSTPHPLSSDLEKAWETPVGRTVTATVIANDTVYAGAPAEHCVHALNLADGKPRWRFVAGGRVDTPPTIHGERVLFGCADGYVYALRARDGALAWRLRAAPRDRWITAFGDVESAWPVHGSVLVVDNAAYFTAGRSSLLDGGIYAYAADVATGDVLGTKRLFTPHDRPVGISTRWDDESGRLNDVLVGHAGAVYMRSAKLFEAKALAPRIPVGPLHSTAGLRDTSWFSRVGWYLGERSFGEYLVFDGKCVYGVRARSKQSVNGGFFSPGSKGYEIFAAPLSRGRPEERWSVRLPVRVTSMVLAGATLFAAGTPDTIESADPWAAYDGRRGAKLLALSPAEGKNLANYELDAAPIPDGLAAARGRLLVSTMDGRIMCYGGKAATAGEQPSD